MPNKNLNLLVNDYVLIILRVKKEFLISESNPKGYLLNEQNLYPIQQRVYGYKVRTSDMQIDLDSMKLENVGQAESAFYSLDGYTRLKHISLIEDDNKNYLGAAIRINYFNEFYRGTLGERSISYRGYLVSINFFWNKNFNICTASHSCNRASFFIEIDVIGEPN